jgi:hypothetical protein
MAVIGCRKVLHALQLGPKLIAIQIGLHGNSI